MAESVADLLLGAAREDAKAMQALAAMLAWAEFALRRAAGGDAPQR